jgi:hypothetical protein
VPQLLIKMSIKNAKARSEKSDFVFFISAKIIALLCFLKATYSKQFPLILAAWYIAFLTVLGLMPN